MISSKRTMNFNISKSKLLVLLIVITSTVTKDISEEERAIRANFVQKIVSKQKNLEGRIRLVGGKTNFEGNVYIFHAGRWGAVCDDLWDEVAAAIVCKQLYQNKTGNGVPTYGSLFGKAKRKFWIDDVICKGEEPSLAHCTFPGWGISDCSSKEAAGVRCWSKPDKTGSGTGYESIETGYPTKEAEITGAETGVELAETEYLRKKGGKRLKDILQSTRLRLVGGRSSREGRVEVYHDKAWKSLCPDSWGLPEAMTVCQHLARGFAEQAIRTDYFGSSRSALSVRCEGNESDLFECSHTGGGCRGDPGNVAAVVCTDHLADLSLDTRIIEQSAHLQDVYMHQLQCAMEENCLSKSAYEIQRSNPDWQFETRRLLRFTASSLNVGNAEFRPYLPKHLWQWHLCHMHYHSMEVFATFDILDSSGHRVAEGHKASFCLEDNTCLPGVEKKYNCRNYGDQGISVNCSDVYKFNIDCQWVDVTDVPPGDYTFKVSVNPQARVAEQRFNNNAARCSLRLADTYASVYGCTLERP